MKNKFILLAIFSNTIIFGQCNNQSTIIDGVKISQYNIKPFGHSESKQLGYSINKIGNQINLLFTIRFRDNYVNLNKSISIYLSNGEKLNLVAERIGKDYLNGSNIAHMNFILNQNQINLLKNNSINKIILNNEIFNTKWDSSHISILLNCN